jgi:hypothetical protein
MTNLTKEKIHSDYLAERTLTVVGFEFMDIVEDYSQEHWEILKGELIAKGNDFLCKSERYAYFGIHTSNSAHDFIFSAWRDMVKELDCVDPE